MRPRRVWRPPRHASIFRFAIPGQTASFSGLTHGGRLEPRSLAFLHRRERTAKELGARRPRLTPNIGGGNARGPLFQANSPRASQFVIGAPHDRPAIVASIVFEGLVRHGELSLYV